MISILILLVLVFMSMMMFAHFFPTATNIIVFILLVGGYFIYQGVENERSMRMQTNASYRP